MMVINMNPMPLKIVGIKAYSQIKNLFEPLKAIKPKKHPNTFLI